MARSLLALALCSVLVLSGCLGGDGDGDDNGDGAPSPGGPGAGDPGNGTAPAAQTYTGGFETVTPYGCVLLGGTAYDGTVQDSVAVNAATVGGPFEAYINVTTGVDLMVSIAFVDDDLELTGDAVSGASGERLAGNVPTGSTRAIFSGCGIGAGASVWYQAVEPSAG